MRNLGQIHHEHVVGNRLSECQRQFHRGLLELSGVQDAFHRDDACLGVRHFDTDGALAGDRCNDTDAECREAQGDIIFQVADLGYTHTFGRCEFVERDGGAYGGRDTRNLHSEGVQHLDDAVLVGRLLLHVDIRPVVGIVFLEQVERGILIFQERLLRIDRRGEVLLALHTLAGCLFAFSGHGHGHVTDFCGSIGLIRLLNFLVLSFFADFIDKAIFLVIVSVNIKVIVRQVNRLARCGIFVGRSQCRLRFMVFTRVCDAEFHAVGYDAHGIEQFAYHVDGLVADIGQEDDGHDA